MGPTRLKGGLQKAEPVSAPYNVCLPHKRWASSVKLKDGGELCLHADTTTLDAHKTKACNPESMITCCFRAIVDMT